MAYEPVQQRRIDAGRCKDCGAQRAPNGTSIRCRPCADEHNAKVIRRKQDLREEWQVAGPAVCNICGAHVEDARYKSCERCRGKRRTTWANRAAARRRQREAGGICVTCLRPALRPSRYCRRHVLDNCLRRYHIAVVHHEALWQKLEEQDFRCYYTGVVLVPGVNLSIDHRVPVSRGGTHDLGNLVWCDKDVNAFKNDLTDLEFIARCKTIAARFS